MPRSAGAVMSWFRTSRRSASVVAVCLLAAAQLAGGRAAGAAAPEREAARMVFPLRGTFLVVAGHAEGEAHAEERSQRFAIDVVNVTGAGEELRGAGTKNSDWVGFGRPVRAPAGGRVVRARDGYADNAPGTVPGVEFYRAIADPAERRLAIAGNCVVIDHGGGAFSVLAHLRRGSVRVRRGARVRAGEVVGRVGNSGNSTEPHLHYHLMDGPRLLEADGLPVAFANVAAGELRAGRVYETE